MIPGLGRSPGEGIGYPLQYSDLENSMDCIVHGVASCRARLRDFYFHFQRSNWRDRPWTWMGRMDIRVPVAPLGFPVAQSAKNLPAMQENWVRFLGWEGPLEKEMEPTLAWRVPQTEEPSSCSPWHHKSWTQLSDYTTISCSQTNY